jgi:16S rRNA (uracil1498-N3)-methyltransferase
MPEVTEMLGVYATCSYNPQMLPRFLADSLDAGGGTARLSQEEARHLSQVLRLAAGDEVAVFDGAGREFRARVDRVARDGADLVLLEEFPAAPEPAVRLTLAQAVIKGEKMDDVIRDATMMGVTAIEPLVTEHTVAHMKAGRAPERWRRIAIASAKQCRRAVVPAIGPGTAFDHWLVRDGAETRLLLVEPSAAVEGHPLSTIGGTRPASASLIVGPEGGWSTGEIESAVRAGCVPLTLGRRTLRADAIPIVAIGLLQFVWGDL